MAKTAKKKAPSKKATAKLNLDGPKMFAAKVKELGDWRAKTLEAIREVVESADPGVKLEWKWNVPVWSCDGIVTTGETYKAVVKMTFAHGAKLKDPAKLFNSSLEGATRRAIDFKEGDKVNAKALKALVKEAIEFNRA